MTTNVYNVTIIKSGAMQFESESADSAENQARNSESEGMFDMDIEVIVEPVSLNGRSIPEWTSVLQRDHGIEITVLSEEPAEFTFTGWDGPTFDSVPLAVQEAVQRIEQGAVATHNKMHTLAAQQQRAAGHMAYGTHVSDDVSVDALRETALERASDFMMASQNEAFAQLNGGVDNLKASFFEALAAYEGAKASAEGD